MRGCVDPQGEVYHTFILDDLVPANHPLKQVKTRADRILAEMSAQFTRGYAINQRIRKRVEEIIGWLKVAGGLARARFVGRWKIKVIEACPDGQWRLLFTLARYGGLRCPSEILAL